jgi:hypothetical protein
MPNNLYLFPTDRIPPKKEIIPVYAVIVLLIYGWTLYKFNYNLPAWLGFLNFSEIFSIFAYSMVVNFLESLIMLSGILFICFILPQSWFYNFFVARGTGLSLIVLGFMQYIAVQFKSKDYYPSELIRWSPLIVVLILLLVYFAGRVPVINSILTNLADRAIIFLYLTLPVSAISLIVIIIRLSG